MFGFSTTWLAGLAVAIGVVVLLAVSGKVPLRYNFRNLAVRWRTTAMTALAFTLVISLLTVMLAFVNGMNRLTEASGHPENVVLLSAGQPDEVFSNLGFSDVRNVDQQAGILHEGDRALASRETYMLVNQPITQPRPGGPQRRFLQVRGIEDPWVAARVHNVKLFAGSQWFSDAGVRNSSRKDAAGNPLTATEAVIGSGVARVLGSDLDAQELPTVKAKGRLDVGDEFLLGEQVCFVVGVMQSAGSTFDSEVWAKRTQIGPRLGKDTITTIVARAESADSAKQLKEFFNNQYKEASLQALLETEYFASLSGMSQQFAFAILIVAVVMAVGGAFGVMNTMFAAVNQRTKDIGVLRILGFARWQILVSFLLESLLIAAIGGAIGCLLGCLADGLTATSVVGNPQQGGGKTVILKLVIDGNILAKGAILTFVMGTLGGVLPALSAMRLRPLEALR